MFQQKQKKHVKAKPKTPASVPDMFILIGVGELKCIIEVHCLTYINCTGTEKYQLFSTLSTLTHILSAFVLTDISKLE